MCLIRGSLWLPLGIRSEATSNSGEIRDFEREFLLSCITSASVMQHIFRLSRARAVARACVFVCLDVAKRVYRVLCEKRDALRVQSSGGRRVVVK